VKTRIWKVYGSNGHRQRESFCESTHYDFSNDKIGKRIIDVYNSDVTNTNEYSIISITRNTSDECYAELYGQITDGVFENCNYGDVIEINKIELEKILKTGDDL